MQNNLEPRTLNEGQWHSKTDLEKSQPKLLKSRELREYYSSYEQNDRSYGIGRLAKKMKPKIFRLVERKCQRQGSSNLLNGKAMVETVIADRKKRNTKQPNNTVDGEDGQKYGTKRRRITRNQAKQKPQNKTPREQANYWCCDGGMAEQSPVSQANMK